MKKTIPFTITEKRSLGTKLSKKVAGLSAEHTALVTKKEAAGGDESCATIFKTNTIPFHIQEAFFKES